MNIQPKIEESLIVENLASINPYHQNFDFEQWAKAVRKQMKEVLEKKTISSSNY